MLVFNLFGKKDTECIRFERYFLSMGNCLEDFWSIMRKDMNGFSREEEEAFIGEYKNVLIVMSESYMTDINVLYYMDILRSLKEKGYINIVAMIQNDRRQRAVDIRQTPEMQDVKREHTGEDQPPRRCKDRAR